ncbi:unnamed protein product [Ilex paraguariensis]|uniref:Pentatricopeptide repeat-containing protein-mitochondrial domain-containing protein n=1 Tax=Ilex paraguariensis TaxID=185542 RepID=A0ABC8UYQ0_9AQUA
MRRTRTSTTAFSSRMLQILFSLQPHKLQIKQVYSIFSFSPIKYHFSTKCLEEPQSSSSSSCPTHKTNDQHVDISSIDFSGIAKSVILRCSHHWDNKVETFDNSSLKDYLLKLSNLSPETIRRFWRVSELKRQDVLEILLGFDYNSGKFEFEAEKVESLWGIFKWASKQSGDFEHLPQSCKLMASMLVQVGLFRDVEFLLSTMENRGLVLDNHEIFSKLIEGYVSDIELDRAISAYDRMRGLGLVPSFLCYCNLLKFSVQRNETQLTYRVCLDMLEIGLGMGIVEKGIYEDVIKLLCRDGKVQDARNLFKKTITLGMVPSNVVINIIASGYCEKKDYDDLLNFFVEMKSAPDVVVGNKIIFSLCRNLGTERADLFMQEFEHLGFCPDEITFGILIGWSCREGKLKNAFIYLSEVLARCLKPHTYTYNALISGVFKEGMWKHARDILHDMDERGIAPDISTCRVLLAGYCKARQFDEVNVTVNDMVDRGLIQLSSIEDPLSKALLSLGLNPLTVKVRRDNNVGFSKPEFFDNLGNGLYLETDLDEYEKTMTAVLDNAMVPCFNSLLLTDCAVGNLKTAAVMVDELARWGQDLSLLAFSTLMKGLRASHCSVKPLTWFLDKVPKSIDQLDQETLNLLVQAHCKQGLTYKAMVIFNEMLRSHLEIENDTYTSLLLGLCKKRNLKGLIDCWELARGDKWLPQIKDCKALLGCLCQKKMLKEALELFETLLVAYPHMLLDSCPAFLKITCDTGFTSAAHVLVDELLKRGCILNCMAYSHLIKSFCKEKRFIEAFMMLDIMLAKNLAPPLDASVLLIPHLCRAGKLEQAAVLKEMGLREQPSDLRSFYCILMSGFFKKGMVGEVAKLFQDMLSKGLPPDDEVYNTLVQGYCKARSFWKVRELLGVMIKKNLSISISSYRNLVRLMCMEGRASFAFSIKELMLKESNLPYIVVYNILIFYLFLSGNRLLVDSLLDELQQKGLQVNGVTYNFVVHGFCCSKAMSRSLQYLTSMIREEFRPSDRNLRAVVSRLCCDGELVKAQELSREMESRGWVHGSTIQKCIVEGLLTCGKLQEAMDFLERMEQKGLNPDNINYDHLIKRICWCGRQDKAVHLLDVMLKKGNIPHPTSYDTVIQGFCKCLRLDQALDFLTEMLERNLKPTFDTWNTLIFHFCENGHTAEAEKLLNSMVQIGESPSREMYCFVINRYSFENNLGKASKVLETMQQNGYEPDFETHWTLISSLSNTRGKDNGNNSNHFLSRLLSESGFSRKDPMVKLR